MTHEDVKFCPSKYVVSGPLDDNLSEKTGFWSTKECAFVPKDSPYVTRFYAWIDAEEMARSLRFARADHRINSMSVE